MWIGSSLAALVVGAILYFAVADGVSGIDLKEIGVIIMAAGAVGFVIALFAEAANRRRTVDREVVGPDGRQFSERQRHSV